jgi:tRNA threonylcarbamoyladenosine biosynthesis protein TsaE
MTFTIGSLVQLQEIVDYVTSILKKGYTVVLLYGDLGSGKTTFVQSLCRSLGVDQAVTSPTFSIIQEYITGSEVIYHMDLYRLDQKQDLEQIGFSEYLDSGNLCLIEWPSLGEDQYDMPHIRIDILAEPGNIRNFKITTT